VGVAPIHLLAVRHSQEHLNSLQIGLKMHRR
jgi:hypothetical protein